MQHRRVGVAEAWRVVAHQRLRELPHLAVRCVIAKEALGDPPVRVAVDDLVLVDDRELIAIRPRRTDRSDNGKGASHHRSRARGRCAHRYCVAWQAEVPTGGQLPRSRPHLPSGADFLVPVQLPQLRPPRGVAEQALSERFDRLTTLHAGEARLHGRLGGYRLIRRDRTDRERSRRCQRCRRHEVRCQRGDGSEACGDPPAEPGEHGELRHPRAQCTAAGFKDRGEHGERHAQPQRPRHDEQGAQGKRGDLGWCQVALEVGLDLGGRAGRRERVRRAKAGARTDDEQCGHADQHHHEGGQRREEAPPRPRRQPCRSLRSSSHVSSHRPWARPGRPNGKLIPRPP